MDTTPDTLDTAPEPVEQPESAKRLLVVLDDLAEHARHYADPRDAVAALAKAFADYLRSPD